MLSQSTFEFNYPSTVPRARSFAGGDLESDGEASPFTPLAQHLLSTGQYLDFLAPSVKDDDDLDVLFLTADETVITKFMPATDDLSLDGSFLLNNWALLEDKLDPSPTSPTISSSLEPAIRTSNAVKAASLKKATASSLDFGSILKSIQPSLSKVTQSLPSSSATKASSVKKSEALSVDPVASSTDLPCRVNDQFSRAEDALKATIARLQTTRAIKQVDPAPQGCVRLADVNAYGYISVISIAVDSAAARTQDDCPEPKSVDDPLPPTGSGSSPLLPSSSSSSGRAKPLNKRKAPKLPAKPNPRKRSKVDDDDDFVDRPEPKKRRAPAVKKASTRRAPSSWSERRHPCTLCDWWCKRAGDLERHMKRRDHVGVEEKCPYPGCSKTFTRKDSAKRHLLNEHDGVPEAEEAA